VSRNQDHVREDQTRVGRLDADRWLVAHGNELTPLELRLYLALRCFVNDSDGECFPSVGTLAANLGLTGNESRVRKARDGLITKRFVSLVEGGGGRRRSNRYHVMPFGLLRSDLNRVGDRPCLQEAETGSILDQKQGRSRRRRGSIGAETGSRSDSRTDKTEQTKEKRNRTNARASGAERPPAASVSSSVEDQLRDLKLPAKAIKNALAKHDRDWLARLAALVDGKRRRGTLEKPPSAFLRWALANPENVRWDHDASTPEPAPTAPCAKRVKRERIAATRRQAQRHLDDDDLEPSARRDRDQLGRARLGSSEDFLEWLARAEGIWRNLETELARDELIFLVCREDPARGDLRRARLKHGVSEGFSELVTGTIKRRKARARQAQ